MGAREVKLLLVVVVVDGGTERSRPKEAEKYGARRPRRRGGCK